MTSNNKSSSTNSVIRVLFLYGNDVSNPEILTNNIKTKHNAVLHNSDLQHTISVADTQVLNTDFGTDCRRDTLDKMIAKTDMFTNLDSLVSNAHADMVLVVTKGAITHNCGFGINSGRVGGEAVLFSQNQFVDNSDDRYATTSDNYALGDLTAIHEIGHAMGGYHAMERDGFGNPVPSDATNNNQAIVSLDAKEQTIMGGYNLTGCDFEFPTNGNVPQQSCVRFEQFSKLPGNAEPFSDNSPSGATNRNIAAYFDNTTMPEISAYTSNPPAPTIAPTFNVTNENCYGLNSLDWNQVNLANNYQVYRSKFSNFVSPWRVYKGSNSSLYANYSSDAYYRVKACNESGCSGYSNQVHGLYIQGCQ